MMALTQVIIRKYNHFAPFSAVFSPFQQKYFKQQSTLQTKTKKEKAKTPNNNNKY